MHNKTSHDHMIQNQPFSSRRLWVSALVRVGVEVEEVASTSWLAFFKMPSTSTSSSPTLPLAVSPEVQAADIDVVAISNEPDAVLNVVVVATVVFGAVDTWSISEACLLRMASGNA